MTCEQCGKEIKDGEDFNTWGDDVVTHERCYPREDIAKLDAQQTTEGGERA